MEGLCRMVGRLSDYLKSFPDPDLDTFNLSRVSKKKKRIKAMPDVNFTHQTTNQFIGKMELNIEACLDIEKEKINNDYLFSKGGWIGPGENIKLMEFWK